MKIYNCDKFDESKCEKDTSFADIVLSQFDVDEKDLPISVLNLRMPLEEQDKMRAWILINWVKFKRMTKKRREREMEWLVLQWFPTLK